MKITQFSDLKKHKKWMHLMLPIISLYKNTAGINKLRDRLMSELTIEELIHVKNIVEKLRMVTIQALLRNSIALMNCLLL
ncbi:MAG: hypothetical protein HWD59_09725 [Coxiellaceae bacterium]|nr:MAG: hypothetical protein HWD59_09725 [Coxiellaceae bacterium]